MSESGEFLKESAVFLSSGGAIFFIGGDSWGIRGDSGSIRRPRAASRYAASGCDGIQWRPCLPVSDGMRPDATAGSVRRCPAWGSMGDAASVWRRPCLPVVTVAVCHAVLLPASVRRWWPMRYGGGGLCSVRHGLAVSGMGSGERACQRPAVVLLCGVWGWYPAAMVWPWSSAGMGWQRPAM